QIRSQEDPVSCDRESHVEPASGCRTERRPAYRESEVDGGSRRIGSLADDRAFRLPALLSRCGMERTGSLERGHSAASVAPSAVGTRRIYTAANARQGRIAARIIFVPALRLPNSSPQTSGIRESASRATI